MPNDTMIEKVARAVLDDLEDRKGIKQELHAVRYADPEIYEEIKQAIGRAAIEAMREPDDVVERIASTIVWPWIPQLEIGPGWRAEKHTISWTDATKEEKRLCLMIARAVIAELGVSGMPLPEPPHD